MIILLLFFIIIIINNIVITIIISSVCLTSENVLSLQNIYFIHHNSEIHISLKKTCLFVNPYRFYVMTKQTKSYIVFIYLF